jgi:hypothetical protein
MAAVIDGFQDEKFVRAQPLTLDGGCYKTNDPAELHDDSSLWVKMFRNILAF